MKPLILVLIVSLLVLLLNPSQAQVEQAAVAVSETTTTTTTLEASPQTAAETQGSPVVTGHVPPTPKTEPPLPRKCKSFQWGEYKCLRKKHICMEWARHKGHCKKRTIKKKCLEWKHKKGDCKRMEPRTKCNYVTENVQKCVNVRKPKIDRVRVCKHVGRRRCKTWENTERCKKWKKNYKCEKVVKTCKDKCKKECTVTKTFVDNMKHCKKRVFHSKTCTKYHRRCKEYHPRKQRCKTIKKHRGYEKKRRCGNVTRRVCKPETVQVCAARYWKNTGCKKARKTFGKCLYWKKGPKYCKQSEEKCVKRCRRKVCKEYASPHGGAAPTAQRPTHPVVQSKEPIAPQPTAVQAATVVEATSVQAKQ